jgi:hypothetical protein
LSAIGLAQSGIFVSLLWGLRTWTEPQGVTLYSISWCGLLLGLVGWAGLAQGLLLSALAGRHKPIASFLLPLVMIAQIVFSVQIAGRGEAPLHEAYGEFNLHGCRGSEGCLRRAQFWLPEAGGRWVCDKCQTAQLRAARHVDLLADQQDNRLRPSRWAVLASYLTISRYGDIALRSFAYHETDSAAFSAAASSDLSRASRAVRFGYSRWRQEAAIGLVVWIVLLLLATAGWLTWERDLRRLGRNIHSMLKASDRLR